MVWWRVPILNFPSVLFQVLLEEILRSQGYIKLRVLQVVSLKKSFEALVSGVLNAQKLSVHINARKQNSFSQSTYNPGHNILASYCVLG